MNSGINPYARTALISNPRVAPNSAGPDENKPGMVGQAGELQVGWVVSEEVAIVAVGE